MADDTLRLRAEVTDGFSAPLRRLNNLLGETAKHPAGKWLRNEWQGVATSFDKITSGLNTGLVPALSRVGVTSLSVGAAVTGIGSAIKSFATSTRDLNNFSRSIGLSVDQLREMKAVGEHVGMSWDTTQGSMKRFAGNLDQVRRRWGETYGSLRAMNLGDLAEKLVAAPNMQSAVDAALQTLRSIQNPVRRREVAELLFGTDQWATVATQVSPRVRAEIRKMLGEIPAGSAEAAESFSLNVTKMELGVTRFRNEAIGPLLKDVNEVMTALNQPAVYAGIKREWDGLTSGVQGFLGELRALKELWDAISKGDVQGALRALRKADGASGPLAQRVAPLPGDGRVKQLEEHIADVEARKAHNDRLLPGRVPERQAELTREIERLTAELKRAREDQSLIQKQSFDGSAGGLGGFGGAKLWSASLGGFGGPGRGVWSFNGRTWDRREDPSGRGGPDVWLPPNRGPRMSPPIPRQPFPGGPRSLFGELPTGGGREGPNPGAYKEVLDFIAKAEGTAGRGDYNASLGYGRFLPGRREMNLTGMTLDQISELGRYMRRQPGNPNSSALGRYQIVGQTMRSLMRRMGLKGDELFDEKMQDRMAAELARDTRGQPGRLANEWASLRGARLTRAVELMSGVDRSASTVPGSREGGPAASRLGDSMMGRSFGPGGVAAGAPKMEATGAVNIHLSGGLEKAPARINLDGLFKDVKISRGSQMGSATE